MAIFIRANTAFTNPLPDTPLLPAAPFTSDTFTRANASSIGRTTDARLGGSAFPWLGNTEVFGIAGNQAAVRTHTGAFFMGLAAPAPDYILSVRITAHPSEAVYMDTRRPRFEVSPTQDGIRLSITSGGITMLKRVNVVGTTLGDTYPYALGATVGLKVKGTTAQLLIDGRVMETHTITDASLQSPGHAGFSGTVGLSGFAFDDLTLTPA